MRPETIVHRHKCDSCLFGIQARQHHVAGVQRVDKIRREGILLFYSVQLPVNDICIT